MKNPFHFMPLSAGARLGSAIRQTRIAATHALGVASFSIMTLLGAVAGAHAQTGVDPWQTIGTLSHTGKATVCFSPGGVENLIIGGSHRFEDGSRVGVISRIFGSGAGATEVTQELPNSKWTISVCVAPNGDLFATGYDAEYHRLIFKSTDQGATWTEIARPQIPPGVSTLAPYQPIAADSAGNVFMAVVKPNAVEVRDRKGNLVGSERRDLWTIVKLVPSEAEPTGYSTTLTDITFGGGGIYNYPAAALCVGNDLYVGGRGNDLWEVRRFPGGNISNAANTVIDRWTFKSGTVAAAQGLAADGRGGIVAVGSSRGTGPGTWAWTVRRGAPSATGTWNWVLSDRYSPMGSETAHSVTVAHTGDIFVAGRYGADYRWLTRRLRPNSSTWVNSDAPFAYGQDSGVTEVLAAPGRVLGIGWGNRVALLRELRLP